MAKDKFEPVKVVCLGTRLGSKNEKFTAVQLVDSQQVPVGDIAYYSKLGHTHPAGIFSVDALLTEGELTSIRPSSLEHSEELKNVELKTIMRLEHEANETTFSALCQAKKAKTDKSAVLDTLKPLRKLWHSTNHAGKLALEVRVLLQHYGSQLDGNIKTLHQSLHAGKYKPMPARRVFIPKEDGSERALSILCLEDKIVQQATVQVLNQIYEVDFMGFSYGFRAGKGQHDALDALHIAIMKRKVNWVLDLDISKFFDTVEHDWLIRLIEHRIGDKRVIRLIKQWIKVGVVDENGHRQASTIGTPQGSVISPLLANIYLHYSFDLWLNQYRKSTRGEVTIIRYADDAVLGFQKHQDAKECLAALVQRLKYFGLKVHPKKTKLIRFGRFAPQKCAQRCSLGKPETVFFKIVDTLRLNFTLSFPSLHWAHYQGSTLLRRWVHSFLFR